MWNQRFASEEYVYGTQPNTWLVEQSARMPPRARVLSLGEGEGRNAVWLAERGHEVVAVDGSQVGLAKAQRLASERGVRLETVVADLADYEPAADTFDALVLVYLHLPPTLRAAVHARAERALRAGAVVVVEAFTTAQLAHESGGPKDARMLYSADLLRQDFTSVQWQLLDEEEVDLDEGPLHRGRAAIVRGLGLRR